VPFWDVRYLAFREVHCIQPGAEKLEVLKIADLSKQQCKASDNQQDS
jgi:hypothetical protein